MRHRGVVRRYLALLSNCFYLIFLSSIFASVLDFTWESSDDCLHVSNVEVHSVNGMVTSVLAHISCPSFSDLALDNFFLLHQPPKQFPSWLGWYLKSLTSSRTRHQPAFERTPEALG